MKRLIFLLGLALCIAGKGLGQNPLILLSGSPPAAAGGPAFVASSYVENLPGSTGTSVSATGTVNVPAGALVVIYVSGDKTISGATCGSDTGTAISPTWDYFDGTYHHKAFYVQNASANASATISATFSTAAGFRKICAVAYTGMLTSGVADVAATNHASNNDLTATSTNRTSQNVTTTAANELLVAFWCNWDNARTNSAAAGWNLRSTSGSGAFMAVADKTVTSTGTYPSGNFGTVNTTDPYFALFVTFKY